MTVLVLTHRFDPTADMVIRELNGRGVPVFRCDVAEFPERLSLTTEFAGGWIGTLRTPDRETALEEVTAVYYRRPSRFNLPDGMSRTERRFAAAEARIGFGGVLASLPCTWVNHPHRISEAEYKPLQLCVAANCGLLVPRSLITNDPIRAQEFATSSSSGVIYKSLSGGPVGENGKAMALYTTVVSPDDYGHPGIARTAHLFQERVMKQYDVRVTAVGDECFAVRIDLRRSLREIIDWRADYSDHEYQVTEVPDSVQEGIAGVLEHFGLNFGALDFVITSDGDWVFLEVNPNGQWGWLQLATGLPIAAALADVLEKEEISRD